ncbi:AGE family epimerase/isomerase [Catenovulum sp. 2E275]|uniref:AGE family epimerase/isomerase n=1 Tax=Catenovulum sp. 2E275 TaxID=2980497 RepID=UPI0021D0B771|nr:AGE family epimerase/isomerase [Catenovulum sp. 2E275]MCU4674125.1 AGE family epimerase/isomerase [Catenovulum sp. 2E275]
MNSQTYPDFYSKSFLLKHIRSILDFYDPIVIDDTGGYFQNYLDNGDYFEPGFRQLVSSTRIIVNYALASFYLKEEKYKDYALHGLAYLEEVHWQPNTQTYAWTLQDHKPQDLTQQAYGYAFVLLAYASVHKAGIKNCEAQIKNVFDLLEKRFWQANYGLYADELSATGILSDYRGQNSNMHLCEALIAAYDATGENTYLQRAQLLAENITVRQAAQTQGLIWEHFTPEFLIDWDYNKDDPKNLYRPWGFQPGHQTEWTKLLLAIHEFSPQPELVSRAQMLFEQAYKTAWDNEFGGLIYGFSPDGNWCDTDKYFWVQAESFAAAAMLYKTTDNPEFLTQYYQLWQYSWDNMIDHQYGAWFRILTRNNQKYSNQKSSAGAKCDYHTLGACFEVLKRL